MKLQALIALSLVAGTLAFTAPPSGANPCPVVSSSSGRDQQGAVVEAQCSGQSAPQPPNTSSLTMEDRWAVHCQGIGLLGTWQTGDEVVSYPTQALTIEDVVDEGLDPTGTYTYWSHQCNPADGVGGFTSQVVYENTPPVPITVLRDRARDRITIPDPTLASNPPLDDPDRHSVVRIPTWLWIDDDWEAIGPEEDSSGFITVSVSAVPQHITWDMGDGTSTFDCGSPIEAPGIPWVAGLDDDQTNCKYTYLQSSAGQGGDSAYTISAEILWRFEWTVNGVPQPPFEDYEAAAPDLQHQVGEILAVETSNDS